jgi:Spy/CpxP family protein refolding chaperone
MTTRHLSVRSIVAAAALALALPAATGAAQPGPAAAPGGRMGPAGRVLRGALAQLDLTQEQKDKVKVVIAAERSGLETMAARNRADALALRDLAAAPQPDPKAVGEAFLKVRQNRETAKAARQNVLGKIEAILTPAQKAKFEGYVQAARDAGRAARGRRAGAIGQ